MAKYALHIFYFNIFFMTLFAMQREDSGASDSSSVLSMVDVDVCLSVHKKIKLFMIEALKDQGCFSIRSAGKDVDFDLKIEEKQTLKLIEKYQPKEIPQHLQLSHESIVQQLPKENEYILTLQWVTPTIKYNVCQVTMSRSEFHDKFLKE